MRLAVHSLIFFLFLRFYLFLDRGEGRERRETSMCACLSPPSTGDLACNPAMCWESNRRPFVSQSGAQSAEPHKPGPWMCFQTPCTVLVIGDLWLKTIHLAHHSFHETFAVTMPSSSCHLQFQQLFGLGNEISAENIYIVDGARQIQSLPSQNLMIFLCLP